MSCLGSMLIKCLTMSNNARPGTVAFVGAYAIYYNYLETQISVYWLGPAFCVTHGVTL